MRSLLVYPAHSFGPKLGLFLVTVSCLPGRKLAFNLTSSISVAAPINCAVVISSHWCRTAALWDFLSLNRSSACPFWALPWALKVLSCVLCVQLCLNLQLNWYSRSVLDDAFWVVWAMAKASVFCFSGPGEIQSMEWHGLLLSLAFAGMLKSFHCWLTLLFPQTLYFSPGFSLSLWVLKSITFPSWQISTTKQSLLLFHWWGILSLRRWGMQSFCLVIPFVVLQPYLFVVFFFFLNHYCEGHSSACNHRYHRSQKLLSSVTASCQKTLNTCIYLSALERRRIYTFSIFSMEEISSRLQAILFSPGLKISKTAFWIPRRKKSIIFSQCPLVTANSGI